MPRERPKNAKIDKKSQRGTKTLRNHLSITFLMVCSFQAYLLLVWARRIYYNTMISLYRSFVKTGTNMFTICYHLLFVTPAIVGRIAMAQVSLE